MLAELEEFNGLLSSGFGCVKFEKDFVECVLVEWGGGVGRKGTKCKPPAASQGKGSSFGAFGFPQRFFAFRWSKLKEVGL